MLHISTIYHIMAVLRLGSYINLGTDHATCGRLGAYGHYKEDAKTMAA
jgi:hypothetical protein